MLWLLFEIMLTIEAQGSGFYHLLALKLDINKAYDWVERDFIKIMMQQMGVLIIIGFGLSWDA